MEDGPKKKFNIIAIMVDGVRFDRAKLFPNFKKLFSKGALFSNMVAYAPYTIASLYSIFTGTYGSETGADNYYGSLSYKRREFKTITEYLKENGFFTFGDIANDVVAPSYGFDKLIIQKENYNYIKEHKRMLTEAKCVDQEKKKFFLFLHNNYVTGSLVKTVVKQHTDFDKEYFKNKEKNLEKYDSYIKETDDYLGTLFEEIEQLGLLNNSMIIIFADHGVSTGEKVGEKVYGSFCYDYTLKMLSLLILPQIFPVKEIKNLTSGIDIMPTILDILNIDGNFSSKIKGKSLLPLIEGKEIKNRVAFSETGGLGGPYPSPKKPNVKAIRTQNWKLIYNVTPDTKELYNLTKDPSERNNLAGKGLIEEKELWSLLKKEGKIEWVPKNI